MIWVPKPRIRAELVPERAARVIGVVGHQSANHLFPWLERRFVPLGMIGAALGFLERVLDAAAGVSRLVLGIDIFRIVGNRRARMAMAHPPGVDPFIADIAVLIGVKHQAPGFDVGANIADLLFFWIVDLEDDVAVVEGHVERQALGLDRARDLGGNIAPVTTVLKPLLVFL